MGYFIRAFCKSDEPPTVQEILDAIAETGIDAEIDNEVTDRDSIYLEEWEQFGYRYNDRRNSVLVECNRRDGPSSVADEEISEFIESVESADDSPGKNKVLKHLEETLFVISCRLPDDIDDDGIEANGALLSYLEKNYDGMIQADGEGFYDEDELVVPED